MRKEEDPLLEAIVVLEDRIREEQKKRDDAIVAINRLQAQLDAANRERARRMK